MVLLRSTFFRAYDHQIQNSSLSTNVKMAYFARLSNLAGFVDHELLQIENSFRALSTSSQNYRGNPAEISQDLEDDIKELSHRLDDLINFGQEQSDRFEQVINSSIEMVTELDEKVDKLEDHAANFGYLKPAKTKEDLRSLIYAEVSISQNLMS